MPIYRSWRDFPPEKWRWPHFSPEELACRGTGMLEIHEPSLDKLEALRQLLGKPMIVQSAYRSAVHNRKVGGARHSQHLVARAFDISMANHDPAAFEEAARAVGFTGFGYYVKQNFMHIDTGPARSWGKPFPPRPVTRPVEAEAPEAEDDADRFAPEPERPTVLEGLAKPEVLAPVATSGIGALFAAFSETLKTSLPLQIGLATLLVLAPIAVATWFVLRQRSVRAGD